VKKTILNIRIEEDLKNKIMEEANEQGLTLSEMNRKMIKDYLEDKSKKKFVDCTKMCDLATEVQKLKINNPNVDTEEIEEALVKAWLL